MFAPVIDADGDSVIVCSWCAGLTKVGRACPNCGMNETGALVETGGDAYAGTEAS